MTATSANPSTMIGHGGEQLPTTPTSVWVSLGKHLWLLFCNSSCFIAAAVLLQYCSRTTKWSRVPPSTAHLQLLVLHCLSECVTLCPSACDCNGKSSECYYDAELYRATGHGGHCRNCADNTDGPNCERCLDNYYREQSGSRCLPCGCNPVGEFTPKYTATSCLF